MLDEFYPNPKHGALGRQAYCKPCDRARTAEYRQRNLARIAQNNRTYRLKLYGLTDEEYEERLAGQGGVCAVCKRPPGKHKRLCVDHNHETGEIRGLLCLRCNAHISALGDSLERVQAVLTYLGGESSRF